MSLKDDKYTLGEAAILLPLGGLAVSIFISLIVVPIVLICGFVGSYLWGWFLVPLGVTPIGVLHFSGIALLVNFVIPVQEKFKNEDKSLKGALLFMFAHLVLNPAFTLLLGWIIHLYTK